MTDIVYKQAENELMIKTLKNSVYPDASDSAILIILEYCRARKLDPFLKPVHIVNLKDKQGKPRETIWPGIELYRIQASRCGNYAGLSRPIFGPEKIYLYTFKDKNNIIQKKEVVYPEFVEMSVKKIVQGHIGEYHHIERWIENINHNNPIWFGRPYAQLCVRVESQLLRKVWPEAIGGQLSYEEIEGTDFINIETGEITEGEPEKSISNNQKISFETLQKINQVIESHQIGFITISNWLIKYNVSDLKDLSENKAVEILKEYEENENVK